MIFLSILRFNFLRFFAYPVEIIAEICRTFMGIGFLAFFWWVVSTSSHVSLSLPTIISYFFIAGGVKEIVMAQFGEFGGVIARAIKGGAINNYLTKPTSPILSMYGTALGINGLVIVFAILMIVLGILINPPHTIYGFFFFLLFLFFGWLMCFGYNVFEGSLYFHSPDASGIRASIAHIMGIFSGILVPLYLFPTWLYQIIKFTPFPWMVYGPTNALQFDGWSSDVFFGLCTVVVWSVIINVSAYAFWKWSMKKYEAVGI
jgi:ABC-2 type transport system permease protein